MSEYPTPAGEVLSSIIRNEMLSMFGSNNVPDIDFVNCFSSVDDDDINSRVEIVKANYATYNGMISYMNGYSLTSGTSIGTAIGTNVESITEEDEFEMYGTFELNDVRTFMIYSFPTIFDIGKDVKDYKDAFEKFMEKLSLWLSFPLTPVTMSGFKNMAYVTTAKGYVFFNGDPNLPEILDKLDDSLSELYSEDPNKSDMFKKYWDIMASAIVEYINYNEIVALDTGFILSTDTASGSPIPIPYVGSTSGKVTFGSDVIIPISIDIPTPIPNVVLRLIKCISLPIKWPTITVTDLNCFEKEITMSVSFGSAVPIAEVATVLKDKITEGITSMVRKLNSLCYSVEEIEDKMKDVGSELTSTVSDISSSIGSEIEHKVISPVISPIKLLVVKFAIDTAWAGIAIAPPILAFHKILTGMGLGMKVPSIATAINKVSSRLAKFSLIAEFSSKLTSLLNIITDKLSKFNVPECDCLKPIPSTSGVEPDIPEQPVIPEVPDDIPTEVPEVPEVVSLAIDSAKATSPVPLFFYPLPMFPITEEDIEGGEFDSILDPVLAGVKAAIPIPAISIPITDIIKNSASFSGGNCDKPDCEQLKQIRNSE